MCRKRNNGSISIPRLLVLRQDVGPRQPGVDAIELETNGKNASRRHRATLAQLGRTHNQDEWAPVEKCLPSGTCCPASSSTQRTKHMSVRSFMIPGMPDQPRCRFLQTKYVIRYRPLVSNALSVLCPGGFPQITQVICRNAR